MKLKKQSKEWDYQVDTVPAPSFIHNGLTVNPGGFYNVRRDTGESVGHVSKRYGLVQNRDVLQNIEDAFDKIGLEFPDRVTTAGNKIKGRDVVVLGNGEQMFATYTFGEKNDRPLKAGDQIGMRFTAQNSFDGNLKLSFALGALRLVCTNGMTSMQKEFDMTSKHNSKINVNSLAESAQDAVARFEKVIAQYDKLAEVEFDHEQGFNILNRLGLGKVIPQRHASKIAQIWQSPDYKEDEKRNLWNLYNAGTQYLTRNVEGKTFKRSNEMNQNLLRSLTNMASRGTIGDWIKPVPAETLIAN
tara:strand:- start:313 stop:1215 length:903 start_codon:yes stop_codon:yes gene_type:complete